jgi:hypothetical protein
MSIQVPGRTPGRIPGLLAASLLTAFCGMPALADDLDEMRKLRDNTVNLVNQLVQQGVISRERADEIIKQAQQTAAPWSGAQPPAAVPAAQAAEAAAPSAPASAPVPAAVPAVPAAAAAAASAPTTPAAAAAPATPAAEAAPAASPSTNDLIKALVESGVISKEKAYDLQQQAERKAAVEIPETPSPDATPEQKAAAAAAAPAKPGDKTTVRVPYVPEIVKQQIRDQVKEEVLNQARRERWGEPGVLPEWIRALTWSGDLRLRGETDLFPNGSVPNLPPNVLYNNPPLSYGITNTQNTRNRFRLRARLGLEGKFSDHWSAGIRLATGGAGGGSNPASENVTLGNYDTRLSIGLDRAYLRYQPASWVSVTGGRFGNPFFTPTDLVWCDTVSFEGLVSKFSGELSDSLDGVLIAGAFPIQLKDNQVNAGVNTSSYDKWLFGYQGGVHWQFAARDDLKLAAAFYDYHRVEGIAATTLNQNQYDSTAAGFRQKGNQTFDIEQVFDSTAPGSPTPTVIGLVSKFRELNFSTALDLADFAPTHLILSGDYVRNLGFHVKEIENRIGNASPDVLRARVTGYQFRLLVGRDKVAQYGDWQAYAGYRYVERDAVLDAFTDTDFHLGGTDAKGYFVGARYGVAKNTAVGLRWLSADRIESTPPALAIDVLQLDLTASF